MSQGPPSYSWLSFPFHAPLSGAVTQDISPHLCQGLPEIEVAVITEAGSFGAQLGLLTGGARTRRKGRWRRFGDPGSGAHERRGREAKGTPLEQLVVIDAPVDDIKERHRRAAEREARRAPERPKTFDERGYARFVMSLNP